MRSRVVLVRGTRTPSPAGGGCCGGDVRPFDEGGTHGHTPPADEVGDVYRALRDGLSDVDVQIVSPSNWVWLLPELVRGARRRGLRGAALRRSVRTGLAVSSLLVDGVAVSSGTLPTPEAAVAMVARELAAR